jgi:hypothetical protein
MTPRVAVALGAQRIRWPRNRARSTRTAWPTYRTLVGKDLSAIPVCGQSVRPLASQLGRG